MLADYYSYRYDLPETWEDLVDVMTNHSEKKNHLFKILCQHAVIIGKTNDKSFKCYINSNKNFRLIKDIDKYLNMNILKEKKIMRMNV